MAETIRDVVIRVSLKQLDTALKVPDTTPVRKAIADHFARVEAMEKGHFEKSAALANRKSQMEAMAERRKDHAAKQDERRHQEVQRRLAQQEAAARSVQAAYTKIGDAAFSTMRGIVLLTGDADGGIQQMLKSLMAVQAAWDLWKGFSLTIQSVTVAMEGQRKATVALMAIEKARGTAAAASPAAGMPAMGGMAGAGLLGAGLGAAGLFAMLSPLLSGKRELGQGPAGGGWLDWVDPRGWHATADEREQRANVERFGVRSRASTALKHSGEAFDRKVADDRIRGIEREHNLRLEILRGTKEQSIVELELERIEQRKLKNQQEAAKLVAYTNREHQAFMANPALSTPEDRAEANEIRIRRIADIQKQATIEQLELERQKLDMHERQIAEQRRLMALKKAESGEIRQQAEAMQDRYEMEKTRVESTERQIGRMTKRQRQWESDFAARHEAGKATERDYMMADRRGLLPGTRSIVDEHYQKLGQEAAGQMHGGALTDAGRSLRGGDSELERLQSSLQDLRELQEARVKAQDRAYREMIQLEKDSLEQAERTQAEIRALDHRIRDLERGRDVRR